jgi:hypothetical protein
MLQCSKLGALREEETLQMLAPGLQIGSNFRTDFDFVRGRTQEKVMYNEN